MDHSGLSGKRLKQKVRQLCGIAYEREMRRCLDALFNQFFEYRKEKMTPWELVDAIHKFHDDTARKLYVFYQKPSEYALAHAVSEKLMDPAEIPEPLRDSVRKFQKVFHG